MSEHQAHARLSPSGSKKWMACAGSITLEAAFPDESSIYADNGTAMHTVAKMCLTEHWQASKAIGTKVPVHSPGELTRVVVFTDAMADETQDYVDTVRFMAIGNLLLVEKRVDYSNWCGVPDQFGTADAIILIEIRPGEYELVVIDLKTGYFRMDPEENSQGMCYALGALNLFEMSHNIVQVRIGIYQKSHGGLREWTCSMDDLMAFAEKLRAAAARVELAASQYGHVDMPAWESMYLNPTPNEQECAFCRARPTCPAATKMVEDTSGATMAMCVDSFDDVTKPKPITMPMDTAQLSKAMKACGFLEDFVKDVRAEVERRLLAGEAVDGFGLELGRQGARKWTDETEVTEIMRKRFRFTIEETFDLSLKSPTQVMKQFGPKLNKKGEVVAPKPGEEPPKLKPKQVDALQKLISRAPASPSVKPMSEITVPYTVPQPDASTFEAVIENEDLS
jgi:hypothetical protein